MNNVISLDQFRSQIEPSIHSRKGKTCRNDCVFFHAEENECPFFKLDYDNPSTPHRCLQYMSQEAVVDALGDEPPQEGVWELIEDDFTVEGDENFLFELIGQPSIDEKRTNYPLEPDYPLDKTTENIDWYTSPDGTFGCWIRNESNMPLMNVDPKRKIKDGDKGWVEKVYRSPVPLHKPENVSLENRSRMCWYVDENGYGQYALIMANEIRMLSFPKPNWWE